jgi:hypothetical protein
MGDSDQTSTLDLLQKKRHNAAVAAEDVAEVDGAEADPPVCGIPSQCLRVKLPKPFGGAHDIGRIGGFAGGEQHERLHSTVDGRICHTTGASYIIQHGFP